MSFLVLGCIFCRASWISRFDFRKVGKNFQRAWWIFFLMEHMLRLLLLNSYNLCSRALLIIFEEFSAISLIGFLLAEELMAFLCESDCESILSSFSKNLWIISRAFQKYVRRFNSPVPPRLIRLQTVPPQAIFRLYSLNLMFLNTIKLFTLCVVISDTKSPDFVTIDEHWITFEIKLKCMFLSIIHNCNLIEVPTSPPTWRFYDTIRG